MLVSPYFQTPKDEQGNGLREFFGFISYGARINTTKDLGSGTESTFTTNSDGSVEITAVPNVRGSKNFPLQTSWRSLHEIKSTMTVYPVWH